MQCFVSFNASPYLSKSVVIVDYIVDKVILHHLVGSLRRRYYYILKWEVLFFDGAIDDLGYVATAKLLGFQKAMKALLLDSDEQ